MLNRNTAWGTILIVCLYANTSLSFTPLLADTHTTFKMELTFFKFLSLEKEKKKKSEAE